MLEALAVRLARKFGYTIAPLWRAPEVLLAERLRRIFAERRIGYVIDVGANVGQYRRFLRDRVGFTGPVLSAEPVSIYAEKCRQAGDDNTTVLQCALGPETGSAEINVTEGTTLNSMLAPKDWFAGNTTVRRETVEVRRLDDIVPPGFDLTRTFLKLDTQGFDLQAARGGPNALSKIPALQTEISIRPLYEGMPTMDQSLAFFRERGFEVADFFLVNPAEHGEAAEFDCLMVKVPS
jgi:FkbM family methyltransferase